jgi:hypothetical protein
MEGDLKEVVGTLIRALGGARISPAEVQDLAFDASGELQTTLNCAYVQLLEYAYDCDASLNEPLSDKMRLALQRSLDEIIRPAHPAADDGSQ